MEIIYSGIFGSKLYGTSNENSDTDLKNIHKDSLEDIVLKRSKDDIQKQSNPKERNTKNDVDFESKELRKFIYDCLNGQTYAMDVLFTPKDMIKSNTWIWDEIQRNRSKLVTRNIMPFIGYCKSQSRKYSDKAVKLDELVSFNNIIKDHKNLTFGELIQNEQIDLTKYKHIKTQIQHNKSTGKDELMLLAADSSFPFNRKIDLIVDCVQRMIDMFGERSQLSRVANGCDFKALYHAMRVCWELEELLTFKAIEFPLKRRSDLLQIRNEKYSREEIEDWLSSEIDRVLKIENTLPEADYDFWDRFILDVYLREV